MYRRSYSNSNSNNGSDNNNSTMASTEEEAGATSEMQIGASGGTASSLDVEEEGPLLLSPGRDPPEEQQEQEEIDSINQWWRRFHKAQYIALVAAHVSALLSVLLVYKWIHQLGGLSTKRQGEAKLVFNWHPLMMIVAFAFMTVASLSFRSSTLATNNVLPRQVWKTVHAIAWSVGGLCMYLGLIAVFRSHNDSVSGLIANMYSFHSWVGMTVFVMYLLQFVAGLVAFGGLATRFPRLALSPSIKAQILSVHQFVGPILYGGVALTIGLGIQEKEGFVGCSYKVEEADLRPWQHSIPAACQVSHWMGLLVLTTTVATLFALHRPPTAPSNYHYS